MSYFTRDLPKFLKDLAKNNDREWFKSQKPRYEEKVKEPFERFVHALIDAMHAVDKNIMITPKEAIFRIYRDTRFSKDKTPYKTQVSAIVSPGGRKDMSSPGLYVQISDKDVRAYSGMYMCDSKSLQAMRERIASEPKKFKRLYSAKAFKAYFGEIHGERNKRIPKEFRDLAEQEPLLYNKQFYYFSKLPHKQLYEKDLIKQLVKRYKAAMPMTHFLEGRS